MQISSHSHFSLPYQGSNPIQKWCGSGVVSAFPCLKTIDFPGFSGTFQDIAVAYEKYFYHFIDFMQAVPAAGWLPSPMEVV